MASYGPPLGQNQGGKIALRFAIRQHKKEKTGACTKTHINDDITTLDHLFKGAVCEIADFRDICCNLHVVIG